jgi:hypothetical protein
VRDFHLFNISSGHSTHHQGHINMKVIVEKSDGLRIYRVKKLSKTGKKVNFQMTICEK